MSQPAASNTLWPSLDQMKRYLESWATYAGNLETAHRALEDRHQALESSAQATEIKLRTERDAIAAPLQARIIELEDEVRRSRRETQVLRSAEETYRRMVGDMLGMNPGAGATTLGLLNDLAVLVEESKRQFRGSL